MRSSRGLSRVWPTPSERFILCLHDIAEMLRHFMPENRRCQRLRKRVVARRHADNLLVRATVPATWIAKEKIGAASEYQDHSQATRDHGEDDRRLPSLRPALFALIVHAARYVGLSEVAYYHQIRWLGLEETMDATALLKEFCSAVERRDGKAFANLFTEDGVYHDVFYGDFKGRQKIVEMIDDWFHRTARDFRWDMHRPVATGRCSTPTTRSATSRCCPRPTASASASRACR